MANKKAVVSVMVRTKHRTSVSTSRLDDDGRFQVPFDKSEVQPVTVYKDSIQTVH